MPRKAAKDASSSAEDPTSPEALADPRRHVRVEPERVRDVSSVDYPGHWPGEEHSWDLARFRKGLKVQVTRLSQRSIDFDLVGVDASIANALRRILIAEVPSIAIEDVYVWNNTGVIVDEVLAHRIGLVPLNVDPSLVDMKQDSREQATDRNTLVFKLQVLCTRKPGTPKGQTLPPDELYDHHEVKSGDLVWAPAGDQEAIFAHVAEKPAPTNLDIVLAKLRPGQQIDMELHAVKGVGKDHAKFSPVATASYRLLPHITLNPEKPVPPELAEKFAKCFTQGVIRVDPKTKKVSVDEKSTRKEQMSREVFRHPEFEDCCKLARVRDYFLFRVESESAYAPERLVTESISVMREKIARLKRETLKLAGVHDEDVQMQT